MILSSSSHGKVPTAPGGGTRGGEQQFPDVTRPVPAPTHQRPHPQQQGKGDHQPGEHGVKAAPPPKCCRPAPAVYVLQRRQVAQQHHQHGGHPAGLGYLPRNGADSARPARVVLRHLCPRGERQQRAAGSTIKARINIPRAPGQAKACTDAAPRARRGRCPAGTARRRRWTAATSTP